MSAARDQLQARIADLEARLAEADETLRAIREGDVDALVVAGPQGDQIFTLHDAERTYRFLVEEMNEGALILQEDGTVSYANARAAELAGTPLEHLIASAWPSHFDPEEVPRLRELSARGMQESARGEFRLLTAGGPGRPVQLSFAPIQREGVHGTSVVVTDLSERKAAEEALRQANAKLTATVADLEHFSHSITHDMRAPLRAMQSFGELLQQEHAAGLDSEGRDYLRRIVASANRMDHLITDALNYSKAARGELQLEPVAPAPLLRGMIDSYPAFQPPRACIEVAPDLPVVLANAAGLTQTFSNLLGNAVKFVEPGRQPRVRIWAEERGPAVRFWVEDNGIGIAPDQGERIFRMFQRLNKGYEGTGIGLALVRKVVEQMHGSVGVESAPGQGSRFWVQLDKAPA